MSDPQPSEAVQSRITPLHRPVSLSSGCMPRGSGLATAPRHTPRGQVVISPQPMAFSIFLLFSSSLLSRQPA
jgi:hypothetical protein